MDHVSDIKLIRTDTTLDLSQKAEKGMNSSERSTCLLFGALLPPTPYGIFIADVLMAYYYGGAPDACVCME